MEGNARSCQSALSSARHRPLTDAQDNPARILFCISRDELYKLRVRRDDLDHFLRQNLRLHHRGFEGM